MQVGGTGKERKGGKLPKTKVVHQKPFFERPEHILFRGNEIVVRTDGHMSSGTTVQESEPVRMEIDAASKRIDGRR